MPITDPYISYEGPSGFPNTDCTPTALPEPTFADCPDGYTAHEGEIVKVFIATASWNTETLIFEADTVPVDWQVSDNYIVSGIITLIGFGDKPLAEATTINLPYNKIKVNKRKHTMNFDFTDMTVENYEVVRGLQGTHLVAIWYLTIDGYIVGGENGIIARIANAGTVHARGENALLTGQVIFEWDNLFDPPLDQVDPPAPLIMGKVAQPKALKEIANKD